MRFSVYLEPREDDGASVTRKKTVTYREVKSVERLADYFKLELDDTRVLPIKGYALVTNEDTGEILVKDGQWLGKIPAEEEPTCESLASQNEAEVALRYCKNQLDDLLRKSKSEQSTADLFGRGVSKGLSKALEILSEWFSYDLPKAYPLQVPKYLSESNEAGGVHCYECPQCEEIVGEPQGFRFMFCPECGAKMDWDTMDKMEEEMEISQRGEVEAYLREMEKEEALYEKD